MLIFFKTGDKYVRKNQTTNFMGSKNCLEQNQKRLEQMGFLDIQRIL